MVDGKERVSASAYRKAISVALAEELGGAGRAAKDTKSCALRPASLLNRASPGGNECWAKERNSRQN